MNKLIIYNNFKNYKKLNFSYKIYVNIFKKNYYHTSNILHKSLFDKILIANRGEIACRVMKTCKRLGIKTVAVYSEPDKEALHVKMADEAICVGPAPSIQSYLNIDNIIQAIKKTGAQAVHPGYGFLSENSHFVQRLEEENIVFIGPPSHAMHAMGDKIESKKIATNAKVHVIPGRLTEVDDVNQALEIIKEIGFPVMIKASAGGGGKGMRIAWNEKEAVEGFRLAKQEAKSSFGDDRLLIEKYIDNPRHIEIQILGDGQGTTLYINERECSIQRRNQKVLEESPSSFIDPLTRKAMGEQAVTLANVVGYKSAGTVEFLVDSQKNFYFLEMNTRLQVEHPITEFVSGLDLVELMIRIAAGERLTLRQEDIPIKGWAMESRVYAEDPLRNFLPSIGTLIRYKEPTSEDGTVRIDSGVREGDNISIYYDPLISKLITFGKNRLEAINKMAKALDSYIIRGVNHNVCFLRAMMEHPRYKSGDISTKFIPQEYPQGFKGYQLNQQELDELIISTSVIHIMRLTRDATITGQLQQYEPPKHFIVTFNNQDYDIQIEKVEENNNFKIFVNGKLFSLKTNWPIDSLLFKSFINEKEVIIQLIQINSLGYKLQHYGTQFDIHIFTPLQKNLYKFMPEKKKIDTTKFLVSPMPGRVTSVSVKAGDNVRIGQELVVVEAMKMQNLLRADRDCKVLSVKCKPGDDVVVDAILVEFE